MIQLSNLSVRHNNQEIFQNLSLHLESNEHLGIIGTNDSGKYALLSVLSGKMSVAKGTMHLPYTNKEIAFLTTDYHFKNRAGINDLFYQQRFHSALMDDIPKVRDVLSDAFKKSNTGYWNEKNIIKLLNLEKLYDEEIIKLSNGETKRLRIASLLVRNPKLLLLHDPLVGLDIDARIHFSKILDQIGSSGIQMIVTLDQREIPGVISRIIHMDQFKITGEFSKENFDRLPQIKSALPTINQTLLKDLLSHSCTGHYEDIIDMKDINIQYDNKQILKHVNWKVKYGERWALSGPNGSGKSTLLSLINGDNPQAYANDIVLFDRKKGSGESIWEIKAKIGFVSPELLHYFKSTQTCEQVVLSGLKEGPLAKRIDESDLQQAKKWLDLLGITQVANIRFKQTPLSVQRLVLLGRALIKKPVLLLLDEPCQGMDESQTENIRQVIDLICELTNITLVYVTHYQEELPNCINQVIELRNGQRV